jgi:hypothetical protein
LVDSGLMVRQNIIVEEEAVHLLVDRKQNKKQG